MPPDLAIRVKHDFDNPVVIHSVPDSVAHFPAQFVEVTPDDLIISVVYVVCSINIHISSSSSCIQISPCCEISMR